MIYTNVCACVLYIHVCMSVLGGPVHLGMGMCLVCILANISTYVSMPKHVSVCICVAVPDLHGYVCD